MSHESLFFPSVHYNLFFQSMKSRKWGRALVLRVMLESLSAGGQGTARIGKGQRPRPFNTGTVCKVQVIRERITDLTSTVIAGEHSEEEEVSAGVFSHLQLALVPVPCKIKLQRLSEAWANLLWPGPPSSQVHHIVTDNVKKNKWRHCVDSFAYIGRCQASCGSGTGRRTRGSWSSPRPVGHISYLDLNLAMCLS